MLTVSWLHPSTKGIYITEAVAQRYSVKKVFLEYHRKTPVPVSLFLINVQAATCNFIIKKRHRQRFFPVNFAKFLRPLFLTEHLRLLLPILYYDDYLFLDQWNQNTYLIDIFIESLNKLNKLLSLNNTWWQIKYFNNGGFFPVRVKKLK